MNNAPLVSIVIPFHWMKGWEQFMVNALKSIEAQTFTDYEVILTKAGKMAENTNRAIMAAKGEYIKILYLDDEFAHPEALKTMVKAIEGHDWLICGASTNPEPHWTDDLERGNNRLGSPSALMIRNEHPLLFDEKLSWLLDCVYYKLMNERCGKPVILNGIHIKINEHEGQMTHILTNGDKLNEHNYVLEKYG